MMSPIAMIDVTRSPRTGIGRYSWEFFNYLHSARTGWDFIGLTFPENLSYAAQLGLQVKCIPHNPSNESEIIEVSDLISKTADVYIATNFSQIVFPRIPIIQVVHDLIYTRNINWQPNLNDMIKRHGEPLIQYCRDYYLPHLKEILAAQKGAWQELSDGSFISELYLYAQSHSIFRSKGLIAVSETTREDLMTYYPISQPLIVAYPVMRKQEYWDNRPIQEKSGEIVICYIAGFEPRKNHRLLFESISLLPDEIRRRVTLVLIGGKLYESHYSQFFDNVAQFNKYYKIKVLSGIPETEKKKILKNSTVFAYPSLDEGFGIPLIEAMSEGIPIVAYRSRAALEVCGEGALYVDHSEGRDFADALIQVCFDSNIRKGLASFYRGNLERLQPCGWKAEFFNMIDTIIA